MDNESIIEREREYADTVLNHVDTTKSMIEGIIKSKVASFPALYSFTPFDVQQTIGCINDFVDDLFFQETREARQTIERCDNYEGRAFIADNRTHAGRL